MKRNIDLDVYIDELRSVLGNYCNEDVIEEVCMHIEASYEEKCRMGQSEEEAIKDVIDEFGKPKELLKQYRFSKYYCICKKLYSSRRAVRFAAMGVCGLAVYFGLMCLRTEKRMEVLQKAAIEGTVELPGYDLTEKEKHSIAENYHHSVQEFGDKIEKAIFMDEEISMIAVDTPTRTVRGADGVWRNSTRCADGVWRTNDDIFHVALDANDIQNGRSNNLRAEVSLNIKGRRYRCEISSEHGEVSVTGDGVLSEDQVIYFDYKVPQSELFDEIKIRLRDIESEDRFTKIYPLHFSE